MPFDEPVAEDQDLYRQAMRLGPPDMMMRTGETTNAQPMPQPANATPPSLPDAALLRHAMSAGMKFSSPDAPQPGSVPLNPNPPSVVTDRSTAMPPAPPSAEQTLGKLIQQRARAGQPIDASDPKYKMSTGMRVLGTAGNFLSGFGGSHRDPTYVGPGATNNQYQRDVAKQKANTSNIDTEIKNTEVLNKENESLYRDAIRQSYESQIGQARTATSEAQKDTAAARQQVADAQKENADLKTREITYDAKTKRFTQNGKVYVPKTIEEGASLEAANGVEGQYTKLWGKERRNQPAQGPQFNARDRLRLEAKARELKKDINDLTDEEINQALYAPRSSGAKKDNTKSVSDAIQRKGADLQAQEQRYKARRDKAVKDGAEADDLAELDREHEDRKKEILDTFTQKVQVLDPDGSIQARIANPQAQAQPSPKSAPVAQPAPQSKPTAQPAPAAPPAAKPQRKVGEIVPTKRGNMKITKILPDGKYEGVPAGQ